MANGTKTQRQTKALNALINSVSLDEASAKSGVPRRTLNRWLSEDQEFVKQFRDVRRQVVEASVAKLQEASSKAVDTLVAAMEEGTIGHRIRAADIILSYSMRSIEVFDVEQRLAALEQAIE